MNEDQIAGRAEWREAFLEKEQTGKRDEPKHCEAHHKPKEIIRDYQNRKLKIIR